MTHAGLAVHQWSYKVLRTGERIVFELGVFADEFEHPYLLNLSQETLTDILVAHLGRFPHARIAWNTRVTGLVQDDHAVTISAEGPDGERTLRAGRVVGADGAHSVVRRAVGLGFTGLTWEDRLVVTDLRFDLSTLGHAGASFQIDPEHGALIGELDRSGGLWRYTYAESRSLPEETVIDRMPAVFKAVLPEGSDPGLTRWSAYRVHERAADRFRAGRVLLAGDAAHVTNPSSALGLAGGLLDSFVLAEALAAVIEDGASGQLLGSYAEARLRAFLDMASPLSSDSMRLALHRDDPTRLEAEVEHYRQVTGDRDRLREYLLLSRDLETRSLL